MSWLKDLYDTYEANVDLVGKYDAKGENPLLPVAHKIESTQVVIILNKEGKILEAKAEDLRDTVIPCSERSMGRTSGVASHPLVDSLSYLALEFVKHYNYNTCDDLSRCNDSKCKDCKDRSRYFLKHKDYLSELEHWYEKMQHPLLLPVLKYIKSQKIISDLVARKVLFLDKDNRLLKSWSKNIEKPAIFNILAKYSQKKQEDIAVRWVVEDTSGSHNLWENPSLYQSWFNYVSQNTTQRGFCSISSNSNVILSQSSPRDIRKGGDGAKIISANDHYNFTYKGKFEKNNADQVATIGLEANHKAHAALKWLIKKQGYNSYETFALVAWSINSPSLPQPMDEDDLFDDIEEQNSVGTKEGVGRNIAYQIKGYSSYLNENEDIIILGIDAPIKDKGRSSIVHYSKHRRSEYLDKLESWHTKTAWRNYSSRSKSFFWGAPSPKHIAEACYKRKVNGKWETNPKVLSRTIKELLPCILHSSPIPKHLVKILIERSSQRGSYKKSEDPKNNDQWHWERILEVTCSVYKHHTNKEYTMALDTKETSRDYLYGRLLAIADRLEEVALYKQATHLIEDKEEKKKAGKTTRLTNATRLMYAFSKKPHTTWQHIHDKLLPYIQRLSKYGLDNFYLTQIQNVNELFEDINTYKDDSPLNGEYLLAFYSQRKDLQPPKNTNKTTKDEPNK